MQLVLPSRPFTRCGQVKGLGARLGARLGFSVLAVKTNFTTILSKLKHLLPFSTMNPDLLHPWFEIFPEAPGQRKYSNGGCIYYTGQHEVISRVNVHIFSSKYTLQVK